MRLTAPIRFLSGVIVLWAAGRIVTIQMAPAVAEPPPALASARPGPRIGIRPTHRAPISPGPGRRVAAGEAPRRLAALAAVDGRRARLVPLRARPTATRRAFDRVNLAPAPMARFTPALPPTPPASLAQVQTIAPDRARRDRFAISAWAFIRQGGPTGLAESGQLGGGQGGLRATYRLTDPGGGVLAIVARVTRPLAGRGAEGALGLAWRPDRDVPIELAVERRIAFERGGRDAWAAGIAGGVDRQRLPLGLELDGYAQAGVVGARARDLYVDGGVAVGRPIALSDRASLRLGAGAWGAAQPGLARFDVGPQAVLRLPIDPASVRVSLEWRQRVAGDAAPRSGLALTLATDF